MYTVLLHIRKTNRREAFTEALSDEFEVTYGDPTNEGVGGNLLILDYSTFQQNGPAAIETFKGQEPQVVYPVLLLVSSDWMSHLRSEVWEQIDDLIGMPPRIPELEGRVRVLLKLHRYSTEAHRFRGILKGARGEAATYKSLFADHPCGVFLVKDGKIEEVNERAERLFETSAENLKGRELASLTAEGQTEKGNPVGMSPGLLSGLGSEKQSQASWHFERSGGETFEARLSVSLVTLAGETFVQVVIYEPS